MDVSGMKIAAMTFRLRASWVHSLKEKRMIVNSLTAKLQNRFMSLQRRLTSRIPTRSSSSVWQLLSPTMRLRTA